MSDTRRLFFAVWPDAATIEYLESALAPIRSTAPDWLRWQPARRWHITVAFVGDVTVDRLPEVAAAGAEAAARSTAGVLHAYRSGRFGAVLWVGVAGGEWLAPAHASLVKRLRLRRERQRYRPHVTIARARGHRIPAEFPSSLGTIDGPDWTPTDLTLVASTMGPAPTYEVIQRWPLPAQ